MVGMPLAGILVAGILVAGILVRRGKLRSYIIIQDSDTLARSRTRQIVRR